MRSYLILFLILTFGCAHQSAYVEPASRADRMLYYYEQDRSGNPHAISSENLDLDNKKTTRVPERALVDIDSSIRIKVRRPSGDPAAEFVGEEAGQALAAKKRVQDLMATLDDLLTVRHRTLNAYGAGNPGPEFEDLVKELSTLKRAFIKEFMKHYTRGSDEYDAANEAIKAGGGLGGLKPFLQAELDAIQAADEKIKAKAKNRRTTLRLEVFLDSRGNALTALHLRGYDSLQEQRVFTRDRWGLSLSETERAKLSEQIKATEEVARALDAVRAKEQSIQSGLRQTLTIMAPDLTEQVEKAEALGKRLSDPERFANVSADLKEAIDRAQEDAGNLTEDIRNRLEGIPLALTADLKEQSERLSDILEIIANAQSLEQRWREAESSGDLQVVATIALDTRALASQVGSAFDNMPEWITEAAGMTKTLLNQEVEGVGQDVIAAFETWLNRDEVQTVFDELLSFYADIQDAVRIIDRTQELLRVGELPGEAIAPEVPEAFDVDIDQLQDTSLDLRKVPGRDGNSILIRATLKEPGRAEVKSTATFEITHYGFYAKLSPAVVLVRPDELASGEDGFRFAPTLGWMHHYRPRPEDSGFARFIRPLQPSLGIHSIFLNFDNEAGIGLGATLSFWNDRLQFGAGYNLSADSSAEGQVYYFVGSDLIGLLQTVGIGGGS